MWYVKIYKYNQLGIHFDIRDGNILHFNEITMNYNVKGLIACAILKYRKSASC